MTDDDLGEFTVERGEILPGRSFSAEALNVLGTEMLRHVINRINARWEATNEPPSALLVTVMVEVR